MRTTEERIELMHMQAKAMERGLAKRRLAGLGSVSVFLAAVLLTVIYQLNGLAVSISDDSTGSSLLSENAGGYVLAAVIAFFIGVIITSLIFRYRNKG